MKNLIHTAITVAVLFLVACTSNSQKKQNESATKIEQQTVIADTANKKVITDSTNQPTSDEAAEQKNGIISKLKHQMAAIDAKFNAASTNYNSNKPTNGNGKLIVFIKVYNKKKLIQIKNGKFPQDVQNIDVTYNILENDKGKIISIVTTPYIESGDWSGSFTQYFNDSGNTFAFQRIRSYYNSMCTDGLVHDTLTKLYDNHFHLLNKSYVITDNNGKSLQKDSCTFSYTYKYDITPTLSALLDSTNLSGAL